MDKEKLFEIIENAPEESGVYLFKDKNKNPIYIGKAVNIKNRLKNHLNQIKLDIKEERIFSESSFIDWIITSSEYEAFILENELIKQYKPKYNVRLKSGSGYPMLVITNEEYPTVKISRKYGEIDGEYFGPFLSMRNAKAMKELIHKLFKLRTCENMPTKPTLCFDYHLGLCSGPCAFKISKNEYKSDVKTAKNFLSGNVKTAIFDLYERLEDYTKKMMFEKAAIIRDQIRAIENVIKKQEIVGFDIKEADIFYFTGKSVILVIIRGHKIVGKEELEITSDFLEEDFEISVISDYYNKGNFIPENIIVNKDFEGISFLKQWLSRKSFKEISISTEIDKQIEEFLKRNLNITTDNLKDIFKKVFNFDLPERIECFDISTLAGQFTVGSCVVWKDGKMDKKEYRRFKVKTVEGIDDYASLEEVLRRRFSKYKQMENPPKLVLIDGGLGQLSVGIKVKKELNLDFLKIFSIAKKEEILYTEDGKSIKLFDYQPLLMLFTKLRDEAHRFALSYNRKLREKEGLKSVLDEIKGIGKKRKEVLYRTYKTIDNILKADEDELLKLGIPFNVAQQIKKYFDK